jgi:hypothetical protein
MHASWLETLKLGNLVVLLTSNGAVEDTSNDEWVGEQLAPAMVHQY